MSKHGFKVIDSDMHVVEPGDLWERYLPAPYRDRAPRGGANMPRDISLSFAHRYGNRKLSLTWWPALEKHMGPRNAAYAFAEAGKWDGRTQLQAMDAEGIDVAVLYPSRGLFVMGLDHIDRDPEGLEPDFAAAIARAYNDWLADMCKTDPTRLKAAAMVAPHDVSAAVEEVRRCVTQMDFRGIFLLPGRINGRHWHDPYYDPLWRECERLGVPATFHGGGADPLEPDFGFGLRNMFQWHTFSHCLGPMYALNCFLGGGVFDRFPNLRAAFLEANCSWAPWMIHRMHDQYEDYIGQYEIALERDPREYFLDNCWVAIEADEHPAKYYVQEFGNDNIVFSTDYPHPDSKFPHALDKFLQVDLSDETRRKILWDNCARLFGLEQDAAKAIPGGARHA
ncbi:MAG: amidohydrolase family protein [Gammaproteobacteria bacterium]